MSYAVQEDSLQGGQPIELYAFALGSESFNYTSAEDTVTIASVSYSAVFIQRTHLLSGAEIQKQTLTIKMQSNVAPASRYVSIVPPQKCVLNILRVHRTDGTDETRAVWKGSVRSVKFSEGGRIAELQVVPLTQEANNEIPRYTFQGLCNHTLYDVRCKIARAGFQFPSTVTTVAGNTLTIPGLNAQVDGYYTAGYVQFGDDYRLILSHTGNDALLPLPFPDDVTGESVDVFAGCDHSLTVCKSKFNNVVNYGGHAFVPVRDIFKNGID